VSAVEENGPVLGIVKHFKEFVQETRVHRLEDTPRKAHIFHPEALDLLAFPIDPTALFAKTDDGSNPLSFKVQKIAFQGLGTPVEPVVQRAQDRCVGEGRFWTGAVTKGASGQGNEE